MRREPLPGVSGKHARPEIGNPDYVPPPLNDAAETKFSLSPSNLEKKLLRNRAISDLTTYSRSLVVALTTAIPNQSPDQKLSLWGTPAA